MLTAVSQVDTPHQSSSFVVVVIIILIIGVRAFLQEAISEVTKRSTEVLIRMFELHTADKSIVFNA